MVNLRQGREIISFLYEARLECILPLSRRKNWRGGNTNCRQEHTVATEWPSHFGKYKVEMQIQIKIQSGNTNCRQEHTVATEWPSHFGKWRKIFAVFRICPCNDYPHSHKNMIDYAWKKVKVRNAVIFKKALVSNKGGQVFWHEMASWYNMVVGLSLDRGKIKVQIADYMNKRFFM